MIPDETVDRVRDAADIVDVIGEHVKLKRAGADYRGPCPFHGGRNPNLAVSRRRNSYHCFKCGVGGDVFTFVREHLGLDFAEAVKYVGAHAGVDVVETNTQRAEADPRAPLWEANSAAAEFFARRLWDDPEAQPARDYLESRGITKELGEQFGLGFAPRDGARFRDALALLGYDDERLLQAGLLVRREGEPEPKVRFWGRLMFPILDASGHHVGFGGRVIGQGEPKYLNSADSPVFNKSTLLYGLNWARHPIRKAERALVVEGYFDVIRLAIAGVEETVAPMGTALTEQQAALLARSTRNVFLLYDSDDAGLKATFRTGLALLRLGVAVRVVTLPDGEDPDSFVARHGRDALEGQLGQAMDLLDRQVQILERKGWFADLHRRRRAIDKLLPTIRATADPLTRDIYLTRLSEASGVGKELLLREAEALEVAERARTARSARVTTEGPSTRGSRARSAAGSSDENAPQDDGDVPSWDGPEPEEQHGEGPEATFGARGGFRGEQGQTFGGGRKKRDWKGRKLPTEWLSSDAPFRIPAGAAGNLERELTRVMLHDRSQVEAVAERYGPASFRDSRYRAIFAALLATGPDAALDTVADALGEMHTAVMQTLLDDQYSAGDARFSAQVTMSRLRILELEARNEAIDRELAIRVGDVRTDELTAEKQRNSAEIRELGGVSKKWGKSQKPRRR